MRKDAWYGKLFAKLKKSGEQTCLEFIRANEGLDIDSWEKKVQRLYLDQEKKPANWTLVNEILIVCGKVK